MKDWNECFACLNAGLPDDVRRLKEAGYYQLAIARVDALLAEDWAAAQNQPAGAAAYFLATVRICRFHSSGVW